MHHITIGICTYKRPKMLKDCLDSLASQAIPENSSVTFCISDNDGSDCEAIEEIVKESLVGKNYIYHITKKRGIVHARNAILDYASENNADYIAFIDDDEIAQKNWIINLYKALNANNCDAVHGVVRPIHPESTNLQWVEKENEIAEGAVLKYVGTGNVMFSKLLFNKWNLRFDERYNMGGGEDIDYFMRSGKLGGKHIHTKKAVVEEVIPDIRIKPSWQLRRKFSDGVSVSNVIYKNNGTMAYLRKYFLRSITRSIKSLAYILYGFAFNKELMIKHLKALYYSLGCLYFAFGLKYRAYKKTTGY